MPAASFVEIPESGQAASLDAAGYLHTTRTFKVMDDIADKFFTPGHLATIVPFDGVGNGMPDIGAVWGTQHNTGGVTVQVVLNDYTITPLAPYIFLATARYSNDPRRAPLGQAYTGNSRYSIVQIPYVRTIPTISSGASGTGNISYQEMSLGVMMNIQRIVQTVNILRSQRANAEEYSLLQVGKLTTIPDIGPCLYEGHDVSIAGPQYVSMTYTWRWEGGVKTIGASTRTFPNNGTIASMYPSGVQPLLDSIAGGPYILPPYHTIELMFSFNGDIPRPPLWVWRCQPTMGEPIGNFPGAANFEINVS